MGHHPMWTTLHYCAVTVVGTLCLLVLARALADNPSANETLTAILGAPAIVALTKLSDRIGGA